MRRLRSKRVILCFYLREMQLRGSVCAQAAVKTFHFLLFWAVRAVWAVWAVLGCSGLLWVVLCGLLWAVLCVCVCECLCVSVCVLLVASTLNQNRAGICLRRRFFPSVGSFVAEPLDVALF